MKIKQIIASVLAGATIFSLAACGSGTADIGGSTGISSTSSDADSYARWLTYRLGEIEDTVVVGVGNDAKYGIDMSDFEDDGYIIRNIGTETLIFGKTDSGLDRAVRKYAKNVEAGTEIEDVTFHEGHRIGKLTLFGADISEFTIVYPSGSNANMLFAVDELVRLMNFATSVTLPVAVDNSDAAHKIVFRVSDDESFRDDGYKYYEENGSLIIEGALARGASNAVYRFLQNECGWLNLIFGASYLKEADEITIDAGLSKSETPIFDYMNPYVESWEGFATDRRSMTTAQMSYGPIEHACHGIGRWTGESYQYFQPCFTDESIYEGFLEAIEQYIDRRIAGGEIPGVQFREIDVAMGDNDYFCRCRNCSNVLRYDKSNAGAMIQFANKLGAQLAEDYNGTSFAIKVFGYFSSKRPPEVTTANQYVYVTYCSNGNCSNHPFDGSKCSILDDNGFTGNENHQDAEWLTKWTEICDNVYVWLYALDSVMHQYTVLENIKADWLYFKSLGIKGLFWQAPYHGLGIKRTEHQLGYEFNWANDMTDAEFEDYLCRILENEYGDGWRYVREYIDLWLEAQSKVDYFHCWLWTSHVTPDSMYNERYVSEHSAEMIALLEKAESLANTAAQERRCGRLSLHTYYQACYVDYFRAYDANDTEKLEYLNGLYDHLITKMTYLGFVPEAITTVDGFKANIARTLEEEAWTGWTSVRDRLSDPDAERRDPPAQYVEDTETAESSFGTEA